MKVSSRKIMRKKCSVKNYLYKNIPRKVLSSILYFSEKIGVHENVCAKMREKLVSEVKVNIQKLKVCRCIQKYSVIFDITKCKEKALYFYWLVRLGR